MIKMIKKKLLLGQWTIGQTIILSFVILFISLVTCTCAYVTYSLCFLTTAEDIGGASFVKLPRDKGALRTLFPGLTIGEADRLSTLIGKAASTIDDKKNRGMYVYVNGHQYLLVVEVLLPGILHSIPDSPLFQPTVRCDVVIVAKVTNC